MYAYTYTGACIYMIYIYILYTYTYKYAYIYESSYITHPYFTFLTYKKLHFDMVKLD